MLKQPGWRIWPGQNAKVADLYCDFENERAQIAIYRFRPGSGGQIGESDIWRILALYSIGPWHEQRGNAKGRIFVTTDLKLSAFLTSADDVLAIAYNTWLLRHFVNKGHVKLAAKQQHHGPAAESRMDQLPIDRLVPEPQDIFSAVQALSGISE